jgi:hypothetical protein
MRTATLKQRPETRLDEMGTRALASAAGALTYAEGVDRVLEVPDADLGRILKLKVLELRGLLLQAGWSSALPTKGNPLVEKVSLRIPASDNAGEDALLRDEWEQKAMDARRAFVKRKDLISTGDLRGALGITRQAVSAATRSARMFTVEVDGETYIPGFFVDGKVDRAILEKVSKLLGKLPGWTKWDFFISAKGSLGDISPLEALQKGKVDEVLRIAAAFAEEIAN